MTALARDSIRDPNFQKEFYRDMVRARVFEEGLIGLWKKGMGFFWTGGPGEEAVGVSLGRMLRLGAGVSFDYFHPHYRNSSVMMACRAPLVDSIRQMRTRATDPYSGGRNFVSHFAIKKRNVVPVSSPLATQCLLGIGTAMAQRRQRQRPGPSSLSVVVIGEASTACPDFASSLVWASRPGQELPLLTVITNNGMGISTPTSTQISPIAERARAFGIRSQREDGLHPFKAWGAIFDAFEFVRGEAKPFVLELSVSRIYGHSSSSGANKDESADCPLQKMEKILLRNKVAPDFFSAVYQAAEEEFQSALAECAQEPEPLAESIYDHVFAPAPEPTRKDAPLWQETTKPNLD